LDTLFRITPTYFHWFAINLYSVYQSAEQQYGQNTDDDIKLQLDGKDYTVKRSRLESTVKAIEVAVTLNCVTDLKSNFGFFSSESICKQEFTMSCLVVRELDRFIFEDELVRNGACLHQGPVCKKTGAHGNPEASDAYIYLSATTTILAYQYWCLT